MQFTGFVEWVFLGVISGGIILLVAILNEVRISITTLNQKIAMIMEKTIWHEKALDKHEDRLTKLEIENI